MKEVRKMEKKKALLIYFDKDEMDIYNKIKEKAKQDKRTIPNTTKIILKNSLVKK